jgi:competence protein ComEA
MDEGGSSQSLLDLLKANLLLVVISVLGVVFLFVGLISFLNKPKAQIEFENAENNRTDRSNPSTSSGPSGTIFVDVSGEVAKPGLYELPVESRIADALEKAGGMTEKADRDYVSQTVNLAQKLEDGSKLFIPSKTTQIMGAQTTGSTGLTTIGSSQTSYHSNSSTVNINKASVQELDKLPGIGAVRAQKIIDNRPYSEKRDLVIKKVVTQKIFDDIEAMISLY